MAHSHGSDDIECIFEYRPTKYMFGSTNYGDIPNIFNVADDCGWDIIAPGYEKFETGINFKISSIENILVLQNGKHKLAVKIQCEKKISAEKAKKEMKLFAKTYRKYTSVRCKWLYSLDQRVRERGERDAGERRGERDEGERGGERGGGEGGDDLSDELISSKSS